MGYSEELSFKLSAHDELSAKLRAAKKELTAVGREMEKARKEYENTGAPEAAKEYRRLDAEYRRLLTTQKELRTATKAAAAELERAKNKAIAHTGVMKQLGNSVVKYQKEIQRTGLVMAAAMTYFAKGALQRFSQVEDASSALSATFGGTGDAMIAWAKRSGDALNLSQADALDALMTFSGYANSAGLEGQKLAAFSEDLVARSADLASYYGGSTADAISAIGSALRGEAEPARRYQIFVDDAAMKAEYFAQTGEKVNGTLTAQQKVLAASALIMKQSSVAQGDLARTADSTANSLKDASQQGADFQAAMGEAVAKGVTPFLRAGSGALDLVTKLPSPVRNAGVAFTVLGVAAMIATPRLIAFNVALKGVGISLAALGPIAAMLIGGATATLQAYEAGEKLNSGQKDLGETMTENAGVLGFVATGFSNIRTVIDRVRGVTDEAARATDDSTSAWTQAARAITTARSSAAGAAGAFNALAAAQDRAAAASTALDTALGRLDRHIARRQAVASYREALAAFKKDPSMASGLALESAMTTAAKAFKDPKRQAEFTKGAIEDIRGAVTDSALSAGVKAQLKTPLRESYQEAMKLLGALQQVAALVATGAVAGIAGTGGVTNAGANAVKRAGGGAIWGAGTATSDSIPVAASNGEYMLKTASARAIGYDTLDWVNRFGRLPAAPLPVVTGPPIVLPPGPGTGRDAPLIGSQTNIINGQVDMDAALARAAREQQRSADTERRTRFAGTR